MVTHDSTPPLRSAVIGTGTISETHLAFLSSSRDATLEAVCDLSPALGRVTAERYGVGRSFTDHRELLDSIRPDAVHVLTPPHTHAAIVSDCLRADAHVFVEKPVAPDYTEYCDLRDLAKTCGRWLVEDHNYRFNEPVLAVESLVEQGTLGSVEDVEIRLALDICSPGGRFSDANLPHPSHRLPCGAIHEFISHLSYLCLRFLPDVDDVRASWANHGGGDLFKYDDLDAVVIGGTTHARIRFSARTKPDCFALTLRGSRGSVETDLFHPYLRLQRPRCCGPQLTPLWNHFANGLDLIRSSVVGFKNKVFQKTPYEGLLRLLGLTYAALRSGGEPPVTIDDMDRTAKLIAKLTDEEHCS